MDAALKTRFVERLREPGTEKNTTFLHPAPNCFCFYGVLCDVIDPDAWRDTGSGMLEWQPLYGLACISMPPVSLLKVLPYRIQIYKDREVNWLDLNVDLTLPQLADMVEYFVGAD